MKPPPSKAPVLPGCQLHLPTLMWPLQHRRPSPSIFAAIPDQNLPSQRNGPSLSTQRGLVHQRPPGPFGHFWSARRHTHPHTHCGSCPGGGAHCTHSHSPLYSPLTPPVLRDLARHTHTHNALHSGPGDAALIQTNHIHTRKPEISKNRHVRKQTTKNSPWPGSGRPPQHP